MERERIGKAVDHRRKKVVAITRRDLVAQQMDGSIQRAGVRLLEKRCEHLPGERCSHFVARDQGPDRRAGARLRVREHIHHDPDDARQGGSPRGCCSPSLPGLSAAPSGDATGRGRNLPIDALITFESPEKERDVLRAAAARQRLDGRSLDP